jgi:hypothetical protein
MAVLLLRAGYARMRRRSALRHDVAVALYARVVVEFFGEKTRKSAAAGALVPRWRGLGRQALLRSDEEGD